MIEVSGLTKYYGPRRAINDVSFTADKGVIGLLGLNGAGKSTTMNIIAGCLSSSSGQVLFNGIDIEAEPEKAKARIGYLPEIPPLYTDMRVDEYLSFIFELKKAQQKKAPHLEEISGETGVTEVRRRLIKNLSKGYRQRVGLAAALIGDPETIVLDEPTVGLDPTQIIEIRNLITRLGTERTIILSSHILSEVQAVCGRVIVLNKGEIAADDTPQNLARAMRSYSSYIAVIEGNPEAVSAVLSALEDVEDVKKLGQESALPDAEKTPAGAENTQPAGADVYEYLISGKDKRDIRRAVSLALSKAGLILLNTTQRDASLENAFIELITADRELVNQ
jgi:ABC-2 type transport system ATP-binding protein